jgi:AcrR family transcriptional regulator
MATRSKEGRYHHGDLRAALVATAVEIIDEKGLRAFSMAEASRRLGVAVSAPYAHFNDRDDLLAAVAVRAWEVFCAQVVGGTGMGGDDPTDPAARLAALAGGYVRFAGGNRPLFEVVSSARVDKQRHPEVEAAERPFIDLVSELARAVTEQDETAAGALVSALEALAHGYAVLLLDGDFGSGPTAVDGAGRRAEAATRALIAGRLLLD